MSWDVKSGKPLQPKTKTVFFFSADYSQIELRIMAHLSRMPT